MDLKRSTLRSEQPRTSSCIGKWLGRRRDELWVACLILASIGHVHRRGAKICLKQQETSLIESAISTCLQISKSCGQICHVSMPPGSIGAA
jgi:hypothetical protein